MTDSTNKWRAQTQTVPNLVIRLIRRVDDGAFGDWEVERIAINTSNFSQTTRFSGKNMADETLSNGFWTFIASHLPKGSGVHVVTAPEASFTTAGLLLHGLKVSSQRVAHGAQRLFVKFDTLLGAMAHIFAPGKVPSTLREAECSVSTRALVDLILPALNIAATEPIRDYERADHSFSAYVERLKKNRCDIEFYAAMIQRFISNTDRTDPFDDGVASPNRLRLGASPGINDTPVLVDVAT